MGKRGYRCPSAFNKRILLRRVGNLHKDGNYHTVEDIVDRLQSNYPDYSRMKQKPFFTYVQNVLQKSQQSDDASNTGSGGRPSQFMADDNGDILEPSPRPHKKPKKLDTSEHKLLHLEAQHLQKRSSDYGNQSSDSVMPSSEDEGGLSTSSGSFYEEKVEPEYDVTKSMLRTTYAKLRLSQKQKGQEMLIEVEEIGEKAKKIDMVEGPRIVAVEIERDVSKEMGTLGCRRDEEGPSFKDFGGIGAVLEELVMGIIVPLYQPELLQWLGITPPTGILLHGPPGCGKTMLAHAIANEARVPFHKISATEIVSHVSGGSEKNIRELFSKAYKTAPSIVFIDEIDAIASKRENLQKGMEQRIVTQLLTCMDQSCKFLQAKDPDQSSITPDNKQRYVLVIAATNRPDAIDSAFRRPGRFDEEIVLGTPDEKARAEILTVLTRNRRIEGSLDLLKLARSTPGFVGADLAGLVNMAGKLALKRIIKPQKDEMHECCTYSNYVEWWKNPWLRRRWPSEEMETLNIITEDFEVAASIIQPSTQREGFSTIPNVKWEDVGGLHSLREEFTRFIVRRIKYPESYEEFGLGSDTGFLLYGPPGCGKTLIVKALANEAGANFIHIKGPELLNKYVGESELAVRKIFYRARTCSPCIIFFDEVNALTSKRGQEGRGAVDSLLEQLLVELDGGDKRCGVFIVGATNRPDLMDEAALRPGRFENLFYVPLPSPEERCLILKAIVRNKPVDPSVDLNALANMKACDNLNGADLAALVKKASMAAHDEKWISSSSDADTPSLIKMIHFEQALQKITPSVSKKQRKFYKKLSQRLNAV